MLNKNSKSGCIVGLLFFIVIVLFFILGVPFSLFQFMWFFPVILIFIVIVAATGASSGKSKCYKPEQKNDHYFQQQVPRLNPYIVRGSVKNDVQTFLVEDNKAIEPTKPVALFCQFCGTLIDKDARFCQQCGSKLE